MRLRLLSFGFVTAAIVGTACTSAGVSGGNGSGGSSGGASPGSGGASPGSGGAMMASGGGTGSGGAAPASGGRSGTATGGATSGSGGATSGSGGATSGSGGATSGSGGSPPIGGISGGTLPERIVVTDVTIPAGVKAGVSNWRIWASKMLKISPVYTAPLANCGTLVCFTTGTAAAPNARVVRLDATDHLAASIDLGAGLECRGLAAEPDGHFAALLWDNAMDKIWVKRFNQRARKRFRSS